jgi:hypothetical protein
MVRLVFLTPAVAVALGISVSSAQTKGQPNSKVQWMTGMVKAVSASLLTLERSGSEVRFAVDRSTRLLAKGKGAAFNDLVGRPGGRRLTDFVKVGDQVTVGYRQSGNAMIAVEVRVAQK